MLEHGFDSISPSARGLLLIKSLTGIPFAKEAAALICGTESISLVNSRLSSPDFLRRLIHFETRYRSIDLALAEIGPKNILEFSSGFSFRGLSICENPHIQYLDTDLPGIINIKKEIVHILIGKNCPYFPENLRVEPLNVLDEPAFIHAATSFSSGPVTLVNEGLLVYLDENQKRELCLIIHKILKEREGCWITADIYVRGKALLEGNDSEEKQMNKFLSDHHVEENKFEDFDAAEAFFNSSGLRIFKKLETPMHALSCLEGVETKTLFSNKGIVNKSSIRETWILTPA